MLLILACIGYLCYNICLCVLLTNHSVVRRTQMEELHNQLTDMEQRIGSTLVRL